MNPGADYWHWLGPAIAVVFAALGTGGWIGYLIKQMDKRIHDIEEQLPTTYTVAAHDEKYDPIHEKITERITKMETAMPKNLDGRLREVEEGKMSIAAHSEICSTAMRSVETNVASIKSEISAVNKRLSKGDDLFIQLSELAGRMKQHLENQDKKPFVCPALDNARKGGT